jgi:hypothetical protein
MSAYIILSIVGLLFLALDRGSGRIRGKYPSRDVKPLPTARAEVNGAEPRCRAQEPIVEG